MTSSGYSVTSNPNITSDTRGTIQYAIDLDFFLKKSVRFVSKETYSTWLHRCVRATQYKAMIPKQITPRRGKSDQLILISFS